MYSKITDQHKKKLQVVIDWLDSNPIEPLKLVSTNPRYIRHLIYSLLNARGVKKDYQVSQSGNVFVIHPIRIAIVNPRTKASNISQADISPQELKEKVVDLFFDAESDEAFDSIYATTDFDASQYQYIKSLWKELLL